MKDERQQELERLEKELLEDDLLADIPQSLLEPDAPAWIEDTAFEMDETVFEEAEPIPEAQESQSDEELPMKEATRKSTKKSKANAQKREDKWLIILMAIASFLCLGIIGVLIYWLEAFLK